MRWFVFSAATGLLALFGCSTSSDSGSSGFSGEDVALTSSDGTQGPRGNCVGTTPYDAWVADPNLCVYVFATNLGRARQFAFAPNGDLFVNNRDKVTVLWDADRNGASDTNERATFATAAGLNHGLVFGPDGDFVYASSDTTIYRWTYERGDRAAKGPAEIVVKNMPAAGRHNSRTLVFDSEGRLYVNVGSATNTDATPELWATRSQVRRFDLPENIPAGGIDYAKGDIVASGMRNEVGLFIDRRNRLWGVENERDELIDDRFGGDIHTDNPGEEINVVATGDDERARTKFHGYPFCYSEYKLTGGAGLGTQWSDRTLAPEIRKTDAWCRDPREVRPPKFVMQAHWAPLGIVQYTERSLPYRDDFIIAVHGSWNRLPAVGKLLAVARYRNGDIVSVEPIVGAKNASGGLEQGAAGAPRPVDVRQGRDGALYYSDDAGGRIFKVGYRR
ncbi:PQQ-dependent sugar dehydrogenase [Pendulispora albinea]|uniref:PQQ-dependent sugar dehydrogenase n=1 Tax=Pendulispora albinea TaxID=2741071 RepID=A0ABZ2M6Q4_9BACT